MRLENYNFTFEKIAFMIDIQKIKYTKIVLFCRYDYKG